MSPSESAIFADLVLSVSTDVYNENKRITVNRDGGSPMKMVLKTSLVIR